jgi:hypothetical protein
LLKVTPDPRVYLLQLVDWNSQQPKADSGSGQRTEVHCRVSFPRDGSAVIVEYLQTEFYERETPIVGWRHAASMAEPPRPLEMHVVRTAAIAEVFYYLGLEVTWR